MRWSRIRDNPPMSKSILIIDDNAGFRASARRALEEEGYLVLAEAADGGAGIETALEMRPDIAIVDIQLPGIDGFEVARQISQAASPPAIVLVSSRDRADFGSLVEDSPARGFVAKAELSSKALAELIS
jgi:CheY-like chemotaxis protein